MADKLWGVRPVSVCPVRDLTYPHATASQALLPSVMRKFPGVSQLVAYNTQPWTLLAAVQVQCGLRLRLTGREELFTDGYALDATALHELPVVIKTMLPPSLATDPSLMVNAL